MKIPIKFNEFQIKILFLTYLENYSLHSFVISITVDLYNDKVLLVYYSTYIITMYVLTHDNDKVFNKSTAS